MSVAGRPRALSVATLVLLALPSIVLSIPSASATPTPQGVIGKVFVGTLEANGDYVKISQSFNLKVYTKADSSQCTGGTATGLKMQVRVDARPVGGSQALTFPAEAMERGTNTGVGGTPDPIFHHNSTLLSVPISEVLASASPAGWNGAPIQVPFEVGISCDTTDPNPTFQSGFQTSNVNPFRPDAVRPIAVPTIAPDVGATAKVGDPFTLSFGSLSTDIKDFTLTLNQFYDYLLNGQVQVGSPSTIHASVANQGFNQPQGTLALTDNAGNTNSTAIAPVAPIVFDSKLPPAPATTLSRGLGPQIGVALTRPDTDVVQYNLTITNGTATTNLVCPGNGCINTGTSANPSYAVTNATFAAQGRSEGLNTHQQYTLLTSALDSHGNSGPPTSTQITTLYEPSGKVLVSLTSGNGSIGSTFTLSVDPAGLRDVAFVHANLARLTGSPTDVVFSPSQTASGTVAETGYDFAQSPAPAAWLWSCQLQTCDGFGNLSALVQNATPNTPFPFDAHAPSAPSQFNVMAQAGNAVRVSFAAPSEPDVARYELQYASGTSPFQSFFTSGSSTSFALSQASAGFTPETNYNFRVRAIDERGNPGAFSNTVTTFVTASPKLTVTLDPLSTPIKTLPNISGGWGASDLPSAISINFTVRNSATQYLSSSTCTFGPQFSSFAAIRNPDGVPFSWKAPTAFTDCSIPTGTYTVKANVLDSSSGETNESAPQTFLFDVNPPSVVSVTLLTTGEMQQQIGSFALTVNANDGIGSQIQRLTVGLYDNSNNLVRDWSGAPVSTVCPGVRCPVMKTDNTQMLVNFSDAPLGDFHVGVNATDDVGLTSSAVVSSGTLHLRPRLVFLDNETEPSAVGNLVRFPQVYAAFDNPNKFLNVASATPTAAPVACQSPTDPTVAGGLCVPVHVHVDGKARTGSQTIKTIANLTRNGAAFQYPANGNASTPYYFDYSLDDVQLPSELAASNLMIRYSVSVAVPSSTGSVSFFNLTTDWISVWTPEVVTGLNVAMPALDGSTVFIPGNTSSLNFTVNFSGGLFSYEPALYYNITRVNGTGAAVGCVQSSHNPAAPLFDGQNYCRLPASTAAATTGTSTVKKTTSSSTSLWWNWTNQGVAFEPGEYVLTAVLANVSTDLPTPRALSTVTRGFAVTTTPTITFAVPQPGIAPGGFVSAEFDVSFRVNHGYANLTPDNVSLGSAVGQPAVTADQTGFVTDDNQTSTLVTYHVQTPQDMTDTQGITLLATVESPSVTPKGWRSFANASRALDVVLDLVPPAAGVFGDTNWTGNVSTKQLFVHGFGEDFGSGVRTIEARIYNENTSETFDPQYDFGRGGWFSGLTDAWISSDLVQAGDVGYARHVFLPSLGNGATDWYVYNDPLSRPVIWPMTIDTSLSTPLAFNRTYELTLTNLTEGGQWDVMVGSTWHAKATAVPDGAHAGKFNATFRGLIMNAAGPWSAVKNTTSLHVDWYVAGPDVVVDGTQTHREDVLEVPVFVSNVVGTPLEGTTANVWMTVNGAPGQTWYLYAPTGHGRGTEFAPTAIAASLPSVDMGGGKANVTFPNVKLAGVGVWRANLSSGTSGQVLFVVQPTSFGSMGLDRNHTYRIDVRAADRVYGFGEKNENNLVSFDVVPPSVTTHLSAPSSLAWHDTGSMSAGVLDNHCVANVQLVGTTPHGNLTPINFTSPHGRNADGSNVADCSGASSTWTLNLSENPLATDEIGNYSYTVQVTDSAGNVVRDTQKLDRVVQDRQRAIVKFLRLDPPIAQSGNVQKVVAEVFENDAMYDVRVIVQRVDSSGVVSRPLAEGLAKPIEGQVAANGTGNWSARTDEIGLDPANFTEGSYLWTVRAEDVNRNLTCATDGCHQTTILGIVSPDAPGTITLRQPATNATPVNKTPTFSWEITDKKATAANVTLEQKINGSFVKVAPAIAPIVSTTGSPVGLFVNYTAGPLTSNVTMRLTLAGTFPISYESTFTLDAVPPAITANVTGLQTLGNETYAVGATRVNVCAVDNESAIAQFTYTVNDEGQDKAHPATCTAPIAPSGDDGTWTIHYRAKDAAGNVAEGALSLALDTHGPVINVAKHGDELLLTVTDAGSGVDESNVTVHYAYGQASAFVTAKLTRVAGGNVYQVTLPGNSTKNGLKYYFDAKDRLGNVGTNYSAAQPYVIHPQTAPANLPPTLAITAPLPGAKARDSIDLKWIAKDPEEDPITITIALRDPDGTGDYLTKGGENTGTFAVDVSQKAAGAYTLVVTASDGANATTQNVTFSVEHSQLVECSACPAASVDANQPIALAVQVNALDKTVASVSYNVTRDGVVVASGQMQQSQGVWTASLLPTQPGNYKVFISPQYSDGTSEPAREVSSFAVQSAGPAQGLMPPSVITLVVVGVLTVVLAAYGAFVRWK